jgi:hypothetical protein
MSPPRLVLLPDFSPMIAGKTVRDFRAAHTTDAQRNAMQCNASNVCVTSRSAVRKIRVRTNPRLVYS